MRDDRNRFTFSASAAARYLGISLPSLYRLVARRELEHFRATTGGRIRFSEAALEEWLRSRTTAAKGRPSVRSAEPTLADLLPTTRRFN